jgi:hypothetical protein
LTVICRLYLGLWIVGAPTNSGSFICPDNSFI